MKHLKNLIGSCRKFKEFDDSPEVIFGPFSILLKQLQRVLVVVKVAKQGLEPLVFMEAVNKKSCVFCRVVLAMGDGGMGCWVAKTER